MINQLEGMIEDVSEGRVLVKCGAVTYELLIPASDEGELVTRIGQSAKFHTLHYLESQGQGATYLPRLIGFQTSADRGFFELFTTVKGIGNRKALRALQLPCATIAQAIAAKDVATLVSLPEIGRRTAESIVVELQGKVERYMEAKPARSGGVPTAPNGANLGGKMTLINDALAVLTQLGEQRLEARTLIDRALSADADLRSADALVAAVYRLKELNAVGR
ncbi:MAG TPA: Holliday junction branch migration protein RuvA [Phycisphaerales bacterium]|nr:Holliday junction branch migration protein RuvA [Phycisphaerales bacterium]